MQAFLREELRLLALALVNPFSWIVAGVGVGWALAVSASVEAAIPLGVLAMLLSLVAAADRATQLLPLVPVWLAGVLGVGGMIMAGAGFASLAGVMLAGGGFWLLGLLASRLAGQQALGGGDIWLAAALGAWLGLKGLVPWLMLVGLLGLAAVAIQRLHKGAVGGRMPFAPILALAGWVALLHGDLYYHWLGF